LIKDLYEIYIFHDNDSVRALQNPHYFEF